MAARLFTRLKRFSKDLNYLTLSEIKDFKGLSNRTCFNLFRERQYQRGREYVSVARATSASLPAERM